MKKEKLKIYYEDKNLIVVYKKSGIPTIIYILWYLIIYIKRIKKYLLFID